jgi:hypothetical protein
MRPHNAISPEAPVIQALARGVCPICTLMRVFQNTVIEAPHRFPAGSVCNFQAWTLAGSSPAVEAVPIFISMLEDLAVGGSEVHPCDWCEVLREHENEKLIEFSREMKRDNFRNWVRQYGTVCLFHGRKLISILPDAEAEIVRRLLASNQEELTRQLEAFDLKVRRGEKGGGGVLGHIAEFLVSQRGITR